MLFQLCVTLLAGKEVKNSKIDALRKILGIDKRIKYTKEYYKSLLRYTKCRLYVDSPGMPSHGSHVIALVVTFCNNAGLRAVVETTLSVALPVGAPASGSAPAPAPAPLLNNNTSKGTRRRPWHQQEGCPDSEIVNEHVTEMLCH